MASRPYSCQRDTEELHRAMVRRVVVHMRAHLAEPISLDQMAEIARISPYHFNRTFRSLVGVPPGLFQGITRIETAKRLLIDTSDNITEICHAVGFESLGTFSRRFKKFVGVSPKSFRQLATLDFSFTEHLLRQLAESETHRPRAVGSTSDAAGSPVGVVSGHVSSDLPIRGLLVVGLFQSPIPDGQPLACTLSSRTGAYTLPPVANGSYHLLAAVFPCSPDARTCLLYDGIERAGNPAARFEMVDGRTIGRTDLHLRPPHPEDLPILMVAPPYLALASMPDEDLPALQTTAATVSRAAPSLPSAQDTPFGLVTPPRNGAAHLRARIEPGTEALGAAEPARTTHSIEEAR